MLRWADISLLYRKELKSALRERNIVVNSILLPIFLYPLLLWLAYSGITFVSGQTEGFISRIAVRGLVSARRPLEKVLRENGQIEIRDSNDPVAEIKAGTLDALVDLEPPEPAAGAGGRFMASLTYDNSKDRSGIARTRVEEAIRRYRDDTLQEEARKLGITPSRLQLFRLASKNIASSRQMGGYLLGLMLPLFLIIMLAVGCIYPAIDATAGEREKSTWESLISVATSRANIVVAKYLYVASMASTAAILNVIAMMLSVRTVLAPILGARMEDFSFRIPPVAIPLILLVTVLLALFVSAGMMILASFARTFREGQSLVSPFYIALFMPVFFLQFPGIEFTPALALIPVVNVVMVFREAINGVFQWPLIVITLVVELACVALSLWTATAILKYEDFLIGSYSGSFGKFLKERIMRRGGKAPA